MFALAVIIVTGLYQICTGHTANFSWADSETDISVIASSFYSGLFAYTGWNFLNFIIEEMRDPVKVRNLRIVISIYWNLDTMNIYKHF